MKKKSQTQNLHSESVLVDSIGWVLIISSVMAFLMFASFNPSDSSFFHQANSTRTLNLLGKTGANISAFFMHSFGFASFFLPFFILFSGIQAVRRRVSTNWLFGIIGGGAILLCLMSLGGSIGDIQYKSYPILPGGLVGKVIWDLLHMVLNTVGSYLMILLVFGLAVLVSTRLRILHIVGGLATFSNWFFTKANAFLEGFRGRLKQRRIVTEHHRILKQEAERHSRDLTSKSSNKQGKKSFWNRFRKKEDVAVEPDDPFLEMSLNRDDDSPLSKVKKAASVKIKRMKDKKGNPKENVPVTEEDDVHIMVDEVLLKESEEVQSEIPFEIVPPKWRFPPNDIFEAPHASNKLDPQELNEVHQALKNKLAEFDVTGEMKGIIPGPIVTTYELKPDPGIKVAKIIGLQDDLCLALGSESMRIDRIPGRYSIGFEVPNVSKETIYFKEMITHDRFVNSPSKLMITLGKTIEGEPYCSDLAKMPHLLIAGQTGSGKSVGLNAMICSILIRATPDEVKFILIDPKMVEMVSFQDIPHLVTPVINDCIEASTALKWAVMEMESRYKLLARYMCRGLDQFNQEFLQGNLAPEEGDELELIPRIVIVIDELADLMMVARGEVEESIARLAQKSRAVGIHLILATQRPSTDILTGLIKSNLPCRLSYRVAQRNDSRIILDSNGADQLLGKGDALFMPPGSSRLIRIHAPWLSPREINTLTAFLKKQGTPAYKTSVVESLDSVGDRAGTGASSSQSDPIYDKAARLVISSGQASVSYLQRKLSVGYARAAKLIDMMEEEGIVGPHRGSKAREIIVSSDYFTPVDEQLR